MSAGLLESETAYVYWGAEAINFFIVIHFKMGDIELKEQSCAFEEGHMFGNGGLILKPERGQGE